MSSSPKDRGSSNGRDDCQIHVDKEGEACVVRITTATQEILLKELLNRLNELRTELNQSVFAQQKQQQQPKEMFSAIQDMTTKLKHLDDQFQKVNKHVAEDHLQLSKIYTDFNKRFDETKQEFNHLKEQQKSLGASKDTMEKVLNKLDHLDNNIKTSQDEGQKRLSTDLQSFKQQIPPKTDSKPVLDAIQAFQSSFDKEKSKPDILARKIDLLHQNLQGSHSEHKAAIEDIRAKVDPLHKATPETSKTLNGINGDVQAMRDNIDKYYLNIKKILDDINHHLEDQPTSSFERIKQLFNEKFNLIGEQQSKKDAEDKLGSPNITERDNESNSPKRVPLCINGVISSLSDPYVLEALTRDIAKKLADIQMKFPSAEEVKRKQDDLIGNMTKQQTPLFEEIKRLNPTMEKLKQQQQKDAENFNRDLEKLFQPIAQKINDLAKQQDSIRNIESKLTHLSQNIDKESNLKKQSDAQPDSGKEISIQTQVLRQAVDNLLKEQQPLVEVIRQLEKRLEDFGQSNPLKELSTKLDPLSQSIKAIKDDLDQRSQNKDQMLTNLDKKLNQALADSQKRSDVGPDIEKALQSFSQPLKTLKDSIDQFQAQQQNETKQIDPTVKKLSEDVETIKTLLEKQPASEDITSKMNDISQKQKALLEAMLKDIYSKVQPTSKDFGDLKKSCDDLVNQTNKLDEQMQHITHQIDDRSQNKSPEMMNTLNKLDHQLTSLNKTLPTINDISKQIGPLKDALDKLNKDEQLQRLDETLKALPDKILSKSKRSNENENVNNLRQVPLSQAVEGKTSNNLMDADDQKANLFANLLTLQTTITNSDRIPSQEIKPYLKRIQQSPLVRTDRDLQGLVQHLEDLSSNNNQTRSPLSQQSSHSTNNPMNNQPTPQQSVADYSQNKINRNKQAGYLTKSRYISLISEKVVRENWPKLSQRATPLIESMINQPIDFDNGTSTDQFVKQNGLEQYASLTRNATERSDKDYDKISYMMDSIVFDQMTMIGSREAMIRPWDPSLLNRTSSKGSYPYPSENDRKVERFEVHKDISLWMVETDEAKPYFPTEFMPNFARLNEKYDRIQQPPYSDICQKRREDETRWNERYAFTKNHQKILFVNDLRSYFMDYDTKRKYQVHDGVPINPVCRTGIAGRGDLPFWGPNHCVVVVLLRNVNDPEVVLMKHHGDALVLPKGFYGHEARYDNQLKIIQDPVSGQILPPNLLDYWWANVIKLNDSNHSTNNLRRILNDKELKEEFSELFSQKGCNKSVFDNGYVDHPLNTDHAWVESSVWKVQLKDWRLPEMKSAKYAVADDLKNSTIPFVWMKLTDAILVVPSFDRGILVDVLATGMPL